MDKNKLPYTYIIMVALGISLIPIVCLYGQFNGIIGIYIMRFFYPDIYMAYLIQIVSFSSFIIFFVICFLKRKNIFILKSRLFLYCIIFFLWAVFSLSWANNRFEGYSLIPTFFASLIIFLVIQNSFNEEKEITLLIFFIFISGFAVALIGISQYLFKMNHIVQAAKPASTFGNKNMAAQYIIMTLPLGFFLFMKSDNKINTYFFAIASSLTAVYLFYTHTRAGWLACFFQIIFLGAIFIYDKKKRNFFLPLQKKLALCLAFLIFFIMINFSPKGFKFVTLSNFTDTAISMTNVERSGTKHRKSLLINTLFLIKDNLLLGTGLGNWYIKYPVYQNFVPIDNSSMEKIDFHYVHNDYLEIFAELGIFGFAFFTLILFTIFRIAKNNIQNFQGKHRFLSIIITASLLGIFIDAFFSFPMKQAMPVFLTFIYLALIDKISAINSEKKIDKISAINSEKKIDKISVINSEKKNFLIQKQKLSIIFIFPFIFIYFLFHSFKYLKTSQHLSIANKAWIMVSPNDMIINGKKGYKNAPYAKKSLFYLGSGLVKKKEYKKAIPMLKEFLNLYPNYKPALNDIAIAYHSTGDIYNAINSLNKALKLQPHSSMLHSNIAKMYFMQGNIKKAIEFDPNIINNLKK